VKRGDGGEFLLLAQAELEHYREGLLRLCLLLAAVFSLMPLLSLGSGSTSPVVVVAASGLAVAGFLVARRRHAQLYWHLGRRPWLLLPAAAALAFATATQGTGSPQPSFDLPALAMLGLPLAVGRPEWTWWLAMALGAAFNAAGAAVHLWFPGLPFHPLGQPAIIGYTGLVVWALLGWRITELQARHVFVAFLNLGRLRDLPPGLPRPPAGLDIAILARRDIGLTSRELEVALLALAGVPDDEIGLRLAHITPRRQRAVSSRTVTKHLDAIRRKIAAAHGAGYVTATQSVALFQQALDRRTTPDGRPLLGPVSLPCVEAGTQRRSVAAGAEPGSYAAGTRKRSK
jgi:hypothetical protein